MLKNLLLLSVVAFVIYYGKDYVSRDDKAWPRYAEPMAACAAPATAPFDSASLRFQYPAGWKTTEKNEAASGGREVFVAPADGSADEVILFLRESGTGGLDRLTDATKGEPPKEGEAAAPAGAVSQWVPGTNQTFTLDGKRTAYGYLTRTWHPERGVSTSWMLFLWDPQGRMAAISGPRMPESLWPPRLTRNRDLNCAFWNVVRSVEPR